MREEVDKDFTAVSIHTPSPLEDSSWDADSAESDIRRWAGGPDKEDIDWEKYAKGFAYYDGDDRENFGSYKLPHHKVVDSELRTSERGVIAAGNAVSGSRGGVDIPSDDVSNVKSHLSKHYNQFDRNAPWNQNEEEQEKMQDTWTKSEAESWLKDHDFKTSGTIGGESIPVDTGNYWAYRQEDPDKYDDFRVVDDILGFEPGDGVHIVIGIQEDDDGDGD